MTGIIGTLLIAAFALFYPAAGFSADTRPDHRMSATAQTLLEKMIASNRRPEAQKKRDQYRHPLGTLKFAGLEPDMTVVEIWPGGQGSWYRSIIEPFLKDRGHYIPVSTRSDFPNRQADIPYGKVDMVLVFRAHGFMLGDIPEQTYVNAVYSMLRPGGILTIVDHAGKEAIPQDPEGANGYINESYFRSLATKAGFVFLAESDINRNPNDSKNHPKGVWSLPPTLSGSYPLTDTRAEFLKIGESDRFTLKFYKPE